MRIRRKKTAQVMLEYVLMFAAVVLVIAGVVFGVMRRGVNALMDSSGNAIEDAADNFNFGDGTPDHN